MISWKRYGPLFGKASVVTIFQENIEKILELDLFFWKRRVVTNKKSSPILLNSPLYLYRCKCICFVPEKCQWGGFQGWVREGVQTKRGPRADLSKRINHLSLSFGAIRTRNATLNSGINSTIWQEPSALMNSLFWIPDQPPCPSPALSVSA